MRAGGDAHRRDGARALVPLGVVGQPDLLRAVRRRSALRIQTSPSGDATTSAGTAFLHTLHRLVVSLISRSAGFASSNITALLRCAEQISQSRRVGSCGSVPAMRYVLLDRITALEPPERARGVKCVSLSDDVFADHFPGHPVMPGALVIESLAQLGGVLCEATMRLRGRNDLHALLVGIERREVPAHGPARRSSGAGGDRAARAGGWRTGQGRRAAATGSSPSRGS